MSCVTQKVERCLNYFYGFYIFEKSASDLFKLIFGAIISNR